MTFTVAEGFPIVGCKEQTSAQTASTHRKGSPQPDRWVFAFTTQTNKQKREAMKNLDAKLEQLSEIKKEVAALEQKRKSLEAEIIEHLEKVEVVTLEWGKDRNNKATIVYGSSIKIDATGLQGELTDRQWQSVSVRVLDEKLLEDKVARGQIDVELVAKHTTEVPKKPYIRLTEGK